MDEDVVAFAVKRINELIPDGTEDGPIQFDEELYELLKPLFCILLADFEKRVHLANDLTH